MAMLNNQRLTELIDQLMPGGGKPPPCCFFVTHFWGIINHGSCNVIGGMPRFNLWAGLGWTNLWVLGGDDPVTFDFLYQWIGLRENLQESLIFHGKIYGFL